MLMSSCKILGGKISATVGLRAAAIKVKLLTGQHACSSDENVTVKVWPASMQLQYRR